jgi:SAM-dependent methyltransferase
MQDEKFKPIAVSPPSANPWLFRLRCLIDLQLGTIVQYLRPGMAALSGKVLDVGAGESPWREWLPATASYQGLDVGNAGEFGMHPDRKDITYYDGTVMPFADATFDGALCIEVLEHTENPELCVAEMARVLADHAPLLLSVPWSARRHHIPHDYHRFTRERLEALLRSHGFEHIDIAERGNDVAAIASKLVVLTVRLIPRRVTVHALWTTPLALLCAPLTVTFIGAAWVSMTLGLGSREDPLGYFVRARRIARTPS